MAQPRAIRNNNPLNIRKGNNWQGERHQQTDSQFEEFTSLLMGLRAGIILIRNYVTGFNGKRTPQNTIRKIIYKWAPPQENATVKYIQFVSGKTGLLPDEEIRFTDRNKIVGIVHAMCRVECGRDIDIELIQSAYDLVL